MYFRLRVVDIVLPPLHKRPQDIPQLVEHFIRVLAPALGVVTVDVGPEAMALQLDHPWRGNVRKLRNWVERSLILGEVNVSALCPPLHGIPAPAAPEDALDLETLQRHHILAVLDSVREDKGRAAQLLGVARSSRSTPWTTRKWPHDSRRRGHGWDWIFWCCAAATAPWRIARC